MTAPFHTELKFVTRWLCDIPILWVSLFQSTSIRLCWVLSVVICVCRTVNRSTCQTPTSSPVLLPRVDTTQHWCRDNISIWRYWYCWIDRFMFMNLLSLYSTILLWPCSIVKHSICGENVCPSVCLSHSVQTVQHIEMCFLPHHTEWCPYSSAHLFNAEFRVSPRKNALKRGTLVDDTEHCTTKFTIQANKT